MNYLPDAEICWQAVQSRDATYDGQFVTAVKTTGIYCRPSCPARTPKRQNVEFYAIPPAAEANGYRACKRCTPRQLSPQEEQAQRVTALCHYMQAHLTESLTLDDLSQIAHWSPYHLQRVFKQYMGISPRQYVDMLRMQYFKQELQEGQTITQAAHQAGYSSSSHVYDHTQKALGMLPTEYQKGGDALTIRYALMTYEPLGVLLIASTERGICSVKMGDNADMLRDALCREFNQAYLVEDPQALSEAIQQLNDYLAGWLPSFDLPLDIRVTAFQKKVLDAMSKIPYGETASYGDLAKAIGNPKAARAIGQACNKNPVPVLIPCHRVVRSDGRIEGYAYGTDRKSHLLNIERNNAKQHDI